MIVAESYYMDQYMTHKLKQDTVEDDGLYKEYLCAGKSTLLQRAWGIEVGSGM